MKSYDLRASTDDMVEIDGPGGEFVLSVEFEERLAIIQQQKLELAKLRDAFDDAVALLRDWEDYDPADRECTWKQRRDEFLAEHEEAGR